ncbi:MAG: class I SAM-dependent DNA methyltransferase [Candidatus Schekmanbacteria bacterium]|nr:MAG: class I SAM-dependent DNA methyltransferase [Candidatus Schekmanbacteria bacterium]
MIFIWFMRERGLVPKELFEEGKIKSILKDTNPENSSYYKAILQNLFFATLSTRKEERKFRDERRFYKGYNPDFGNQYVFRYHDLFKYPNKIKEYFGDIPFLNGGLFECLDDKYNRIYIDGFTETKKHQPYVPNFLFFNSERDFDLNKVYGTKNKRYKVQGLLNILSSYNFTIDENSPDDADIALDPKLLGRVFENLLASFNPETSTTARKATGSYYTPREIVDYMVIDSLKEYFKTHLPEIKDLDKKLETLFSTGSDENPFSKSESKKLVELIENVRIVDPAVGSGAFPMGALNKMVFILGKIDPQNELWKEAQLKAAEAIPDPQVRRNTKEQIEELFQGKNADYGRKLYLIQKCIYGVDIQQIAVEIAKLRFFISLLVDEKIDKNKNNWGIEPLPNLDFKIMQGNSLISEFLGIDFDNGQAKREQAGRRMLLVEKEDRLIKEFEQKKIDYQNESDKDNKARLKKEVEDLMIRIFETKIKKQKSDYFRRMEEIERKCAVFPNRKTREEAIKKEKQKLAQTTGFDLERIEEQLREVTSKNKAKPFFPWKLYFAEVFAEKGGFDIVIANPPYIQLQKAVNDKQHYADLYKDAGYETFDRRGDIYCLFYELGIKLLRPNGILTYISSNKWMRAGYGDKLRRFFTKYNPLILIDLGPNVFESATVDTNILILQKAENQHNLCAVTYNNKSIPLSEAVKNCHIIKNLSSQAWFIGSEAERKLKEKIERIGKPLKEWYVKIFYGIKTGLNEAFIITTQKRDEILANCKDEEERRRTEAIIKPILRGRDIKRYYYEWAGLWVIIIPAGWTDGNRNGKDPEKFIYSSFPSLMNYLRLFENEAKKRDDQGDYWWELRHCAYYSEFEKEKVVWAETDQSLNTVIVSPGIYLQKTCFMIISNQPKILNGFLNSKLSQWYIRNLSSNLGQRGMSLTKESVEKLPLPSITFTNKTIVQQIESLVDKIIAAKKQNKNADTSEYEHQIDQLVYKLYSLTPEEIAIVEGENK